MVRSSIQRARATVVPPIPTSVEDVIINGPCGETWEQQRFLLHRDADWGIAIFASDENIAQLQRCKVLYMDATFRCRPRPYKQIFTNLGQFHRFVAPLVYALMKRREIGHYRQVLQNVSAAVRRSTHHNWRPAKIICDFEQALWTSIETAASCATARMLLSLLTKFVEKSPRTWISTRLSARRLGIFHLQ